MRWLLACAVSVAVGGTAACSGEDSRSGRGLDTATGLATFEYDGETYDVQAASLSLRVDPDVSGDLQWRSTLRNPDGSLDVGVQASVNIHVGQTSLADLGSGSRVTLDPTGEDGGLLTLHVPGGESRLLLRRVELLVDQPRHAAEVVVAVEGSAAGDEVMARYHGQLPMTCVVEDSDGTSRADATFSSTECQAVLDDTGLRMLFDAQAD